jgi:aryl-alcohol dehydrogenase-like predicted oxidoreductase
MYFEKAAITACCRLGFSRTQRRYRSLVSTEVEKSFSQSLRNLRTDFVDILFIHDPVMAEVSAIHALAPWLERQKTSGRCRYIGLAGKASECVAISQALSGLFNVMQVEDSLAGREANAVLTAGLPLQITYGYWRLERQQRSAHPDSPPCSSVLKQALERNPAGVVLVSTRKSYRITELCKSVPAGAYT